MARTLQNNENSWSSPPGIDSFGEVLVGSGSCSITRISLINKF